MGNKNTNLQMAKYARDDEFYTTYETVKKELAHYTKHFNNKTVLCNCDDPFESNFCKYFLKNFNILSLKIKFAIYLSLKVKCKLCKLEVLCKFGKQFVSR